MRTAFIIAVWALSFAALIAAFWWIVMTLWNAVAAGALGLPELTFWQTGGLLVLIGLLFGGLSAATK